MFLFLSFFFYFNTSYFWNRRDFILEYLYYSVLKTFFFLNRSLKMPSFQKFLIWFQGSYQSDFLIVFFFFLLRRKFLKEKKHNNRVEQCPKSKKGASERLNWTQRVSFSQSKIVYKISFTIHVKFFKSTSTTFRIELTPWQYVEKKNTTKCVFKNTGSNKI